MSKPKNPGYIPGDHWVNCQRCGFNFRASQTLSEWTGIIVCKECWEPRHPQDFVRGRNEDTSAQGNVNPEPEDTFSSQQACSYIGAVAGSAVTGCARAGLAFGNNSTIPSGTF